MEGKPWGSGADAVDPSPRRGMRPEVGAMNRKERRAARKLTKPAAPARSGPGDKPDIAAALLARGRELLAKGDDEAVLLVACRLILMEETAETKTFFIQCVKGWSYFPGAEQMQATLARALREAWTWPVEILVTVMGILERDSVIGPALQRATQAWPRRLPADELFGSSGLAAIGDHPLLLALLESIPVPDRRFERFLTTLRCAVLDAATATRDVAAEHVLPLASALAQQCFINEYVFAVTPDERTRVSQLQDTIATAVESNRPVSPLWLAALAAYVRLDALPAKPLWEKSWPRSVAKLVHQQVREPEAMQRLRATIPHLTPIDDAVSLAVKNQYEQSPYPRWVRSSPMTSPAAIENHLHREFPYQAIETQRNGTQLDILVAGCGTGQQSIDFAQRYKGAKVLAVDLAMSSLAYAKAKTAAAGLTNIDYAQADILELDSLGKSFDLIVSTGVLHHLNDPLAGWRVLVSLLRPAGLMYIGLYSELARRDIVAAQTWISQHGYGATADDIRAARQELARIDDPSWRGVFTMRDFFSTSECRDLLFHVHERRFTLPAIAAFLDQNGLKFLGFDIGANVKRRFRARFPAEEDLSDLKCWDAFETQHPDTFINMYLFWVQKPPRTGEPP
jgi:SAM-dependent methyltransferase